MLVKNIILMQKLLFALLLSTAEQKPSGKSARKSCCGKKLPREKWGKRHTSAVTAERSSIRTRFSGENASKSLSKEFFSARRIPRVTAADQRSISAHYRHQYL